MRLAICVLLLGGASAAFAAPADPIQSPRRIVVFGQHEVLTGRFSHGENGQPVSVLAKAHGEASFASIALVTTRSGGRWSLNVTPAIETDYEATSLTEQAGPLTIRVRPRVTLRRRGGRFVVLAVSTASYQGRVVWLQRRTAKGWKRIAKIVLRARPRRFDVRLPRGVSRLRAYLPKSQAGAGYLAGFSAAISVRR